MEISAEILSKLPYEVMLLTFMIVEAVKQAIKKYLDISAYAPIIAILLGGCINILFYGAFSFEILFYGLVAGGITTGLYAGIDAKLSKYFKIK